MPAVKFCVTSPCMLMVHRGLSGMVLVAVVAWQVQQLCEYFVATTLAG